MRQALNTSSGCVCCADHSRKRRRSILGTSSVLLATTFVLCMTRGAAFSAPNQRIPRAISSTAKSVNNRSKHSALWQGKVKHEATAAWAASEVKESTEDDDPESGWLSWMARGRKRGVSDVRMREAEELGGVPRSDRYSSSDWLHNTASLPNSAILRAIRGPVIFMSGWATFLSILHYRWSTTSPLLAEALSLPQAPHSLMVSALSLLLVFKTNSAYQRFAEGRKIWEKIINHSRDLYRMMNLYENEMGRSKRRRLQRLLAAFPYLLRHRIRPNLVMYRLDDVENVRDPEHSIVLYQDKAANDLDPEAAAVATQEESEGKSRRKSRTLFWVDKRTLPWRLLPQNALGHCARAQNRPLWVCDRMAQEMRNIPDGENFSARERLALISKVEKLSGCIGACERIHQTAVPLNYARHSLRALTLWLFTLPFALVGSLKLVTGPVLFLVSWLLFGVYEIGYSIEDPFQGTLRLSVLCDTIRRDVLADEVIRGTAFSLGDTAEKPAAEEETQKTANAVVKRHTNEEVPHAHISQGVAKTSRKKTLAATEKKVSTKKKDKKVELGDDNEDDEDQDYESSSVNRDSAKASNTTKTSSDDSKSSGPVEVEELPSIPIIRNVDSDVLSNKKP